MTRIAVVTRITSGTLSSLSQTYEIPRDGAAAHGASFAYQGRNHP